MGASCSQGYLWLGGSLFSPYLVSLSSLHPDSAHLCEPWLAGAGGTEDRHACTVIEGLLVPACSGCCWVATLQKLTKILPSCSWHPLGEQT